MANSFATTLGSRALSLGMVRLGPQTCLHVPAAAECCPLQLLAECRSCMARVGSPPVVRSSTAAGRLLGHETPPDVLPHTEALRCCRWWWWRPSASSWAPCCSAPA
jgi:hypothetical protein